MAQEEKQGKGITRRGFMRAAIGGGAGAAVLMEFGPKEAKAITPPKKWDKEAGVVIVGTGVAGLSAAIEAKKAGADVLILEKMPFLGGNTGISTAGMNAVQSKVQKDRGVKSWSVDEFYKWTMMGGDHKNRSDQVRIFAQESGSALDFLVSLGAPIKKCEFRHHDVTDKWGAGLVELFAKRVKEMKIPILTETKVTALIADASRMPKRVWGVRVTDKKGKALNIGGKKAVLLATGGFGANPALVERYDPTLKGYTTTNIPGVSTGECQMMAQSLGADVDGINYIQIHPTVFAFEGKRAMITEGVRNEGGILVNQDGNRFVDEEHRRDEVAQAILKQKGKYAYLIASKNVAHGKIAEYMRDGFAVQSNTLEELAQKMGIDPEKFVQTLNKYNGYVEAKNDPEFKRGLYRMLGKRQNFPGKIETPPFYSVKVTPGIHHTCGGLRINSEGQVMDAIEGNVVIQKLYAAGEVIGGTHGTNRLGANAITDCIVFGRIAGMNAAKEKDRKI